MPCWRAKDSRGPRQRERPRPGREINPGTAQLCQEKETLHWHDWFHSFTEQQPQDTCHDAPPVFNMYHYHFSSFAKQLSPHTAFAKLAWIKPLMCRKSRIAIKLHTSSNDSRFHFVHYIKPSSTFSRLAKPNTSPTSWAQSKITLPPLPQVLFKRNIRQKRELRTTESGLWVKSPKTGKPYETEFRSFLLPRYEYMSETFLACLAELAQRLPGIPLLWANRVQQQTTLEGRCLC